MRNKFGSNNLVDKNKPTTKINKGEFGGDCNRTACDKSNANFFNHSTQKYYCKSCAEQINFYNRKESMELFGHDLCVLETEENKTIK